MAYLIVRDGRLCIVDGRIVTSEGGAPCVCVSDGPPTCVNGIPPSVCITVILSGIGQPDDDSDAVRFFGPIIGYIRGTVQAYAGINRSYQYVQSSDQPQLDFASERVLISNDREYQPGFNYPNPVTEDEVRVFVDLACCNDEIRILKVTAIGGESGINIFEWSPPLGSSPCDWPRSGDTVPNLAEQIYGSSAWGIGGTAEVIISTTCPDRNPEYPIAVRCADGLSPLPVDLETNPQNLPGLRVGDELYRLTDETTTAPPVAVEWLEEVCQEPVQPGQFAIATRCRNTGSALLDPPTVVYAINPVVGIGAGRVFRTTLTANPNCPGTGAICVRRTEYQPTATPATGPATERVSHVAGTACAADDDVTCQACPGDPVDPPVIRPGGPASRSGDDLLDAMGFDPEEELRRIRAGGCCGQPGG